MGGFTFTNGYAENGGAVYINRGTIMMGDNFSGNTAESEGGALFATNSNVMLDSCRFINNSTNNFDGGAMKVSSYDSLSSTMVSVSNTLFMGNSARWAGAFLGTSNSAYMSIWILYFQNSGEYYVGLRVRGNTYASYSIVLLLEMNLRAMQQQVVFHKS